MNTTDRFEPYLEPLFVPGFFGLLFFAAGYLSRNAYISSHSLWPVSALLFSVASVIVYEFLLLFKVIPARALVNDPVDNYKWLRWLLGGWGFAVVLFTSYATFGFVLLMLVEYDK